MYYTKSDSVLVLMSTYNGERYVEEQVDSILSQQNVNVLLWIRDDGSTDNTRDIIIKRYPSVRLIRGDNVGYVKSFSTLVDLAYRESLNIDYYAFADQDDRWYPDKLATAVERIKCVRGYSEGPILYCCNSDLMDERGNLKGATFVKYNYRIRKGNVLVDTLTQGCSMVFNKRALELYAATPPENTIHDRWMIMICDLLGGCIIYDHHPRFAYRIHSGNSIGKKEKSKGKQLLKERWYYWVKDDRVMPFLVDSKEFMKLWGAKIKPYEYEILKSYITYQNTVVCKMKFFLNKDFLPYKPSLRLKAARFFHILFNKI